MARHGISNGPNSRPLDETIAETGPGLPDDSVGKGQLPPGELGAGADEKAEALRRKGWVDGYDHSNDPEGHPS
jgi:hypothetical protein